MNTDNKGTVERIGPNGVKRKPGECLFCGYVTPFDPDTPGFCCPVCGGHSGTVKTEK